MSKRFFIVFLFSMFLSGLNAQFSISTTSTCGEPNNGCVGTATVIPTQHGNYRYRWSNGDSSWTSQYLCVGNYSCTISDSLGYPLDTLQCTIDTFPWITYTVSVVNATCLGARNGSISISPAGGSGVGEWNFCLGGAGCDPFNPGFLSGNFTGLPGDPFYFQVLDYYCGVVGSVTVGSSNTPCVGVDEISALRGLSILPNPATDVINLTVELDEPLVLNISIYDLSGRKVKDILNETETKGKHTHSINVDDLAAGNYVLNFTSAKESFNARFVKE